MAKKHRQKEHELDRRRSAWEEPDQLEQPTLWRRALIFYEHRPRLVTTAAMVLLLGGTTLAIVNYRETVRRETSMRLAHSADTIIELEDLKEKYADTQAFPIILYRMAQIHQGNGDLESLMEAKALYEQLGNKFPDHTLTGPAERAVETVLKDMDFLRAGHEELQYAHTLFTHPMLTELATITDPEFDRALRMSPRPRPDPEVMLISGDVHVRIRLFYDEAPKMVTTFINDLRIGELTGGGLTPAVDPAPKSYALTGLSERPAPFDHVPNDREPDLGMVAVVLGEDGRLVLGRYTIFNDKKENLADHRDGTFIFGRVVSQMSALGRLTADSKITDVDADIVKRDDIGALTVPDEDE